MTRERQFWLVWVLLLLIVIVLFAFARSILVLHVVRGPFMAITRVLPIPIGKVDGYTLRYADTALHARVLGIEALPGPFDLGVESAGDVLRLRKIFEDAGIVFLGTSAPTELDRLVMDRYALSEREWRVVFGERTARIAQLSREMKTNAILQASARRETESLVELLESGVAFSDLAREFSIHESSVLGGSLGQETLLTLKDELLPVDADALERALRSGELSVLDSEKGFIILRSESVGDDLYEVSIIMTPKDDLQTIVDRYRSRYPLKRFY